MPAPASPQISSEVSHKKGLSSHQEPSLGSDMAAPVKALGKGARGPTARQVQEAPGTDVPGRCPIARPHWGGRSPRTTAPARQPHRALRPPIARQNTLSSTADWWDGQDHQANTPI